MERELWLLLYHYLQKYVQYQPWILAATMLWAALHDRPVCWACTEANWSTTKLRPLRIPSTRTMYRRIDKVAMGIFWRALEQNLRGSGNPALLAFIDGKALLGGGNSKDPDATWGRGAGGLARL